MTFLIVRIYEGYIIIKFWINDDTNANLTMTSTRNNEEFYTNPVSICPWLAWSMISLSFPSSSSLNTHDLISLFSLFSFNLLSLLPNRTKVIFPNPATSRTPFFLSSFPSETLISSQHQQPNSVDEDNSNSTCKYSSHPQIMSNHCLSLLNLLALFLWW